MNKEMKVALRLPEAKKIIEQFNLRSEKFDVSANWVSDKKLIQTHVDSAGRPAGKILDLCCGTGQVGRAFKEKGWDVQGVDMAESTLKIASAFFPVLRGRAENVPFRPNSFQAVICRQSFHFLDTKKVLSEVLRVLVPKGFFILSLTVPFSDADRDWLYEIHRVKQPLLFKFYTASDLLEELKKASFSVEQIKSLRVRESINRWMDYAPELNQKTKNRVISMVKNAPLPYKKLHRSQVVDGQTFEDWNWVVIKATRNHLMHK